MSCIPGTPTYNLITDDGWQDVASLDVGMNIVLYDAIASSVLTFDTMMSGSAQMGRIVQVQIREVASANQVQKKDLWLHLYSTSTPATPTANAPYNASPDNHIATYLIRTEDYQRLSTTCEIATVHIPLSGSLADGGVWFRTSDGSTSGTIYGVLVAAEAVDYDASAVISVRIMVQEHSTLSAA